MNLTQAWKTRSKLNNGGVNRRKTTCAKVRSRLLSLFKIFKSFSHEGIIHKYKVTFDSSEQDQQIIVECLKLQRRGMIDKTKDGWKVYQ